jgi:hypothetical protein
MPNRNVFDESILRALCPDIGAVDVANPLIIRLVGKENALPAGHEPPCGNALLYLI